MLVPSMVLLILMLVLIQALSFKVPGSPSGSASCAAPGTLAGSLLRAVRDAHCCWSTCVRLKWDTSVQCRVDSKREAKE